MIWGYHYVRKHPYEYNTPGTQMTWLFWLDLVFLRSNPQSEGQIASSADIHVIYSCIFLSSEIASHTGFQPSTVLLAGKVGVFEDLLQGWARCIQQWKQNDRWCWKNQLAYNLCKSWATKTMQKIKVLATFIYGNIPFSTPRKMSVKGNKNGMKNRPAGWCDLSTWGCIAPHWIENLIWVKYLVKYSMWCWTWYVWYSSSGWSSYLNLGVHHLGEVFGITTIHYLNWGKSWNPGQTCHDEKRKTTRKKKGKTWYIQGVILQKAR